MYKLIFARTISVVGDGFGAVALPFAILGSHEGATGVAIALLTSTLSAAISASLAGAAVDRAPSARIAVMGFSVMAASQILLAAASEQQSLTVPLLVAAQIVFGAGHGYSLAALATLTARLVPRSDLPRLNGLISVGQSIGSVAGPAAAGVVVVVFHPAAGLLVNAASFLAAAVLLPHDSRLQSRGSVQSAPGHPLLRGIRAMSRYPWLALCLPAHLLWNAGAAIFYARGPVAAQHSSLGAGALAVAGSALAAGAIAGGLCAARYRPARPLVIANLAACLMGCEVLAFVVPQSIWVIVTGAVLAGFGLELLNVLWVTAIQQKVAPEVLGSVLALESAEFLIGMTLGYALAVPASTALRTPGSLVLSSALLVLPCGVVALLGPVRRIERSDKPNLT